MKTTSAAMDTALARSGKTIAKMMRIQRRDGTVLCFTDHDEDLEYNLLGLGSATYRAGKGILASDISQTAGLEPNNCEVTGPFGTDPATDITRAGVMGGRFVRAKVHLFEVDWTNLAAGELAGLGGRIAEARPAGGKFIFRIEDNLAQLRQEIGTQIQGSCRATHGDAACGRVPESDTATVTAATDGMQMSVNVAAGPWTDHYFDKGWVIGLTGENSGVQVEIESWTSAGVVKLFGFLPAVPEVGDTFTIVRGCGQTRTDCMDRNNMIRFRGEPDVPSTDQVARPAIPGEGDQ